MNSENEFMSIVLVSTHTHMALLSGTTRLSRYQKKHLPTHTREEEEEGFVQTTRSALSQQGFLDLIKLA